jgi:type IV secretion system protein VirB10
LASAAEPEPKKEEAKNMITIPAGTRVPLVLKHAISSKSARVGQKIYCETTFPVAAENRLLIPAGTYVQGEVTGVKRSGRVKGRAEIQLHFTTLIFPNGYTVMLPGSLESVPGSDTTRMKDEEGTVEAESTKGRDVGTVASTAGTGAVIGAVASRGVKGAAVGGLAGAAVGSAIGLFTRGDEVRLEAGSAVEMEFQRPVVLEERRLAQQGSQYVPVDSSRRLERPSGPQ